MGVRVGVIGIALAFAMAGASLPNENDAGATTDKCRTRGVNVTLENDWIRLYTRGTQPPLDFYACYRRDLPSGTRRTVELISSDVADSVFGFLPPALALASRTVAYGQDFPLPEGEGGERKTNIVVVRFFRESEGGRHADWYNLHSVQAGLSQESKVGSIVVRPNGAVAWISCPMKGKPSNSSGPTCVRPGYSNAVFRTSSDDLEPGSDSGELLDRGKGIDPRSLRRKGDRVYWTKNGRRRSAVLE